MYCDDNQLTDLKVGKKLDYIQSVNLSNNRLPTSVLNTLFTSLNSEVFEFDGSEIDKYINVSNNPGADGCDPRIAEKKGWGVTTEAELEGAD